MVDLIQVSRSRRLLVGVSETKKKEESKNNEGVKTTMKQTIKSILAFAALFLCGGAWADENLSRVNPVTGQSQTFTYYYAGSATTADQANDWNKADGTHPTNYPDESGAGPYDPFMVDGNLTSVTAGSDGYKSITLGAQEGWAVQFGAFNGVCVDFGRPNKIQGAPNFLMIDATSKVKMQYNRGTTQEDFNLYVAGVMNFSEFTPSKNANYYFAGDGVVAFDSSPTGGTHNLKQGDFKLTTVSAEKKLVKKYFVTFGSTSASTKTFTLTGATIKATNASGEAISPTKKDSVTTDDNVGDYKLGQDVGGVYITYVDYDQRCTAVVSADCDFDNLTWAPSLPEDHSTTKVVIKASNSPTINVSTAVNFGEIEFVGDVKLTNQNKLTAALKIPDNTTVTFGTRTSFPGTVIGSGTLKLDPGAGSDCTSAANRSAASVFTDFKGTLHIASGRYQPDAVISAAVTIKVTHGGQYWVNGGEHNNTFILSGQGWSTGHQVESTALRMNNNLGANSRIQIVDDSDHTPTAIGATSAMSISGVFSGSGNVKFVMNGQMNIQTVNHPDFTGTVTGTDDLYIGKDSGNLINANQDMKFGSSIEIPSGKTLKIRAGNANGPSFNATDKYKFMTPVVMNNNTRVTTTDGGYWFKSVTLKENATSYTTFNWKKGWIFDELNIPSTSTFDVQIPDDSDSRTIYVGVDGGTVAGTLKVENNEPSYDVWVSPKGTACANGTIECAGSRSSYVVLRDNASIGQITGERAGAVFGDDSAARTLTLTKGTTACDLKDTSTGKNAEHALSLVIDGDVTVNSNINNLSGTILVNDHTVEFNAMGEYTGTMTLKNASKFNVRNPSANRGTINLDGGTLTMEAGTEGTVNVDAAATLCLLVTDAQLASGYTATGVTLAEGKDIKFGTIVDGSFVETEQQHSGNKLYAGANTWTAHGENNNWDDVGNWSAGKVPAEGESAVVKISGDTTIILPSEAVALDVVAITGSGALTFSGSTKITCTTLQIETTTTVASSQIAAVMINILPNEVLNYNVDAAVTVNGITGGGKVIKTGSAKLILRNPSSTGYAIESAEIEINGGEVDFRTDEAGTPAADQVGDARFRDATVIIGENGSISNYGWLKIPDAGHTLTIKTDVDNKYFMASNGQRLQGDGSFIKTGSGTLNIQGKIDVATTISAGSLAMTNESQIGAVSGSGTLVIPQAVSATVAGAMSCPVGGQGTLRITSNCASGAAVTALQNSNDWTGCVLMDGIDSVHANIVNSYGNANSRVALKNVTFSDAGVTSNVNIELVDTGSESTHSLKYGGNYTRASSFGELSGNGDFYLSGFDWWGGITKWSFSDAANFRGSITFAGDTKSVYVVAIGSADGVAAPSNNGNTFSGIVKVDADKTLGVGGTITSKNMSNVINGTLKVWSSTASFVGPSTTFGEGSVIDLSEEGSLLSFENAPTGTTKIDLGERKIAINSKIVAWEGAPDGFSATLKTPIEGRGLEAKADGMYFVRTKAAEVTATSFAFNTFKIGEESVTLIDGDTVVIPSDCDISSPDQWHCDVTKINDYQSIINHSMNWKNPVKKDMAIGSSVTVYLYAGTQGSSTIENGVTISGGTIQITAEIPVNGTATVKSLITGAGSFKLNEGASLTVSAELESGKVVSGVNGKVVGVSKVGTTSTYTLWDETTPPAPIVVPEGTTEVQLVPGQTATYEGETAPKTVKIVVPNVSGSGSFDITQYCDITKSAGSISATLKDNATTQPTVSAMAMPTTQEEGDQVSLTITPIPGLFYSIVTCDTPNGSFTGGDGEQATNGEAKTLSIAMPDAPVKYFKVRVKATK